MNRFKISTQSPKRQRSPKKLIRSPAFRKKYEQGMPRINHKAIPFHNFYDIEITNREIAEEFGYNFWGCVIPQKKKYDHKPGSESQRKSIQTRGQTIFKNYMKRRPSLNITPRSYDFEKRQIGKTYETITDFRLESEKEQNKIEEDNNREKYNGKAETENFMLTQDDIASINKKSLYEMTPRELEISIQWKKRFLEIFQKKMKEAQKYQYNFRPYKI